MNLNLSPKGLNWGCVLWSVLPLLSTQRTQWSSAALAWQRRHGLALLIWIPNQCQQGLLFASVVSDSATLWIVAHQAQSAHQAHLSMGFSRQDSVQSVSRSVVSNSLWPHGLQHSRPPCPSPTPGVYSNSCPLSQWCHPTISFPVVPFSSCLLSFPASGSFPMSQFFPSGDESIGVSASTSVLPMNIQDWFPLGWTGWVSLQSKGLSRVFSNTTVQKHQFFSAQLSL